MKAFEMLTDEEKQLYRKYKCLQKQGNLSEATQEMRDAVAKLSDFSRALFPLNRRYTLAKTNAKYRGIHFNISLEQFVKLCNSSTVCPILGLELTYDSGNGFGKNKGNHRANSASLDRIDSDKGYTVDNVQIISWAANCMKNKWTEAEFAELILRAQVWAQRTLEEKANVTQV